MNLLKVWAHALNHTGFTQSLARECKQVLPFSLFWNEFACPLALANIWEGNAEVFLEKHQDKMLKIFVCVWVLCLTFCHCPAHKLPVHCDWHGWLVGDSLRQFKLRKQYSKCWVFFKLRCLVLFFKSFIHWKEVLLKVRSSIPTSFWFSGFFPPFCLYIFFQLLPAAGHWTGWLTVLAITES